MLVALLSSTLPALVTPPPRIAVYGGSGFIGSRVCQTLAAAGCEVVSLSRTGMPPVWAASQPWIDGVEWRFLLTGPTKAMDEAKPDQPWLTDGVWQALQNMGEIPVFDGFLADFKASEVNYWWRRLKIKRPAMSSEELVSMLQ